MLISPMKNFGVTAMVVACAHAKGLSDVCTSSFATGSLPTTDFFPGITIDYESVVATASYNATTRAQAMFPDSIFDFCNVTFSYSHNGRNDNVVLTYWLPAPSAFRSRFLSTGGGGYLISSGNGSLPGGVIYGATTGTTDAGFGSLTTNFNQVYLLPGGTPDYHHLHMFGYQAIHEMSVLGKEFTRRFYSMNDTRLFSYYQGRLPLTFTDFEKAADYSPGCSEGGRDGWSQIQRFPDQ